MAAKKSNNGMVIVRTYSAGVHFGELVARDGKEVVLGNARRLWRWYGANTLNEIAIRGVDVSRSRASEAVPIIMLTETIEIIPLADAARANLESAKWSA
jgi:hypothetical protein